MTRNYEEGLLSLGLTLPPAPAPVANYLPAVRSGSLLFISGMIPLSEGRLVYSGRLGKELTVEEGQKAAEVALLNALAVVKSTCGSLNAVRQMVRLGVHVASAEGFFEQSAVANGASNLLVTLFGDAGRHARLALGAAFLPLNAPIEIELIVEVA